ncbi:hypothetical protein ACVIHC_002208 [Bradyrhizobium diazoefficiens]
MRRGAVWIALGLSAVCEPSVAADRHEKEFNALNLCMYTAGIRLFGIDVAAMRKLILSSCDGQIHNLADATSHLPKVEPGGPISLPTEEDNKQFDWEQKNAAKMPMPKFAIDYFLADYKKALERR